MITPEDELELNAMAPYALDEEVEAPQYRPGPETRRKNDPTHRRLQAIAGADVPYLFITWPDGDRATFDMAGMDPANLPHNLRAVADAVEVQLA